MNTERYISARWFQLIFDSLSKEGLDINQLIDESGIDAESLKNSNAYFSEDDLTKLWNAASKLTDNPAIGLTLGINPNLGLGGPTVMSLLTSKNVGEAQQRIVHILQTLGTAPRIHLTHQKDGHRITFHREGGVLPPNHQSYDAIIAAIAFGTRFCTHKDISPSYVTLKYPEPVDTKPYEALFKCPVHFGEEEYAIFYNNEVLTTPFIFSTGEQASFQTFDVAEEKSESFSTQVQSYIKEVIAKGEPKIKGLAEHFHLGTRTVQRRLKEEGWTYNSLLDKTRRDLAERLIRKSHLPLKQVTYELGFTDHSSFYRAFKRWHDCTPSDYQKEIQNKAS